MKRSPMPPASAGSRSAALPVAGYVFAFASSFLFATKGILIKLAYGYGPDATAVLAMRMAFSMPVYAVILVFLLRDPANRPKSIIQTVKAISIGLIGYWFSAYTDFLSLQYISPQFERLILFTYPLFVLCFGAWFFGGRFKKSACLPLLSLMPALP